MPASGAIARQGTYRAVGYTTSVERGTSVPHVQATGTENVQDKVSDREFPMILNCESEISRIRRVPVEYVIEIPLHETESDLQTTLMLICACS